MGSGVALFDYDNDGRLDIFLANGARIDDPTPKGTIPPKDGPKYWNRLYHQKTDGTFEDATEKAGLTGFGYSTGVAVGDYDNDGPLAWPHKKSSLGRTNTSIRENAIASTSIGA